MKEITERNSAFSVSRRALCIFSVVCLGAASVKASWLNTRDWFDHTEMHAHQTFASSGSYDPSQIVWHPEHGWSYVIHFPDGMTWYWNYSVREWLAIHEGHPSFIYAGTEAAWLWHTGGGPGNRSFVHIQSGGLYREAHGLIMPDTMANSFGFLSFANESGDWLDDDWTSGLLLVLMGLFLSPENSECPVVTVHPEDVDFFDPPSALSVDIAFGSGCQPSDELGWFSGQLGLHAEDLIFRETGGGANLRVVANALEMDGIPLLDGEVSIGLSLEADLREEETDTEWISSTALEIEADFMFKDLKSLNQKLDGRIDLWADMEIIEFESIEIWDSRTEARGDAIITMADFSVDGVSLPSGQLALSLNFPGLSTLSVNLQTDRGAIIFAMEMDAAADQNELLIRSVGDSNILGGSLVIENLRWVYDECEDFPVSGSVKLRYDDIDYVITFTGECSGFIISKER